MEKMNPKSTFLTQYYTLHLVKYAILNCSYLGRNACRQEVGSVRCESLGENRDNNEYVAVNIHCEQQEPGNDKEHKELLWWLIRMKRLVTVKHLCEKSVTERFTDTWNVELITLKHLLNSLYQLSSLKIHMHYCTNIL